VTDETYSTYGERKKVDKILVGNREGKRRLGRYRLDWSIILRFISR
jgi:hypothetical protein